MISNNPLVIKHILSTSISEIESVNGVDHIIELIESKASKDIKCRILIDVSNYSFDTLEARRIWSLQFKMNQTIQMKTSLVAIAGSPYEASYTEKTCM